MTCKVKETNEPLVGHGLLSKAVYQFKFTKFWSANSVAVYINFIGVLSYRYLFFNFHTKRRANFVVTNQTGIREARFNTCEKSSETIRASHGSYKYTAITSLTGACFY